MANNINITFSKADMGLENVDNTSDLNKPISTATQTALDDKVDKEAGSRLITSAEATLLGNTSGTNTGDQDLQSVVTAGNTTDTDIQFGDGVGVLLNNTSRLREGTIDSGAGGGVAQICAVGYELKWEAGSQYVMDGNGLLIREVNHKFTSIPDANNDNSQGFYAGSRWILDNGDLYICTDSTTATAVWELQTIDTVPTDGSVKAVESNGVFDALADKVDKVAGERLITSAESTLLGNTSGTNTGDQTLGSLNAEDLANKATNFTTVNDTLYPSVKAVDDHINSKLVGLWDDRGSYDASVNLFPSSGGSGTAGAIMKGDIWTINVQGTLGGTVMHVGDTVRALIDSPAQTAANWALLESAIGYVPENVTNKVTTFSGNTTSDIKYPSVKAIVDNYTSSNIKTILGITTLSGSNTGDQDLSGYQATLTATNLKTLVDTFAATTTPVDADVVPITNSAGTTTKKLSWSNFKSTLLAYFDTIFPRVTAATTGSVISFNVPVVWNTPASPSSSNLTDDLTNAKIGYIQKIYHNKATAPTVPAGWVLIGTGTYTTSTLNIIFAEWVSSTRVEYWITKPA